MNFLEENSLGKSPPMFDTPSLANGRILAWFSSFLFSPAAALLSLSEAGLMRFRRMPISSPRMRGEKKGLPRVSGAAVTYCLFPLLLLWLRNAPDKPRHKHIKGFFFEETVVQSSIYLKEILHAHFFANSRDESITYFPNFPP